ncbi:MAG TPA: PQQ-binding-like beta-propeller repeat protein, partial [Alphaproteobacteria bacterium]|nr:PQQ-binding-like beta-propeller repeat protein [Alphaproteobacteria bacterium]
TDRHNLITPVATMRSSPMAYSPEAKLFFAAGAVAPLWLERWEDPYVFSSIGPAPFIKNHGIIAAIDSKTDKIVWQRNTPYQIENGSGFTATASGLLFHGEPDGQLQALDAKTGDVLWSFQAGANEAGPVAVYEVDGEEYLAAIATDRVWAFRLGGSVPPEPAPPTPPTETSFRGKLEPVDHVAIGATFDDNRSLEITRHYTDETAFKPQRVKVKAGTAVTWTNIGTKPQEVAALDGSWSTGAIAPGASASVNMTKPGTYVYINKTSPWSYGQLVVE